MSAVLGQEEGVSELPSIDQIVSFPSHFQLSVQQHILKSSLQNCTSEEDHASHPDEGDGGQADEWDCWSDASFAEEEGSCWGYALLQGGNLCLTYARATQDEG